MINFAVLRVENWKSLHSVVATRNI